jgi:galactosylceramidase
MLKTNNSLWIKRLQKLAAAGMSVIIMPILAIGLGATSQAGECEISISGSDTGRAFEGIGVVSAGGNTCLLKGYPEPYRSDILDFLFKPKFGAGFQHLKVEMGGGENSTCGAEPSHAIVKEEKDHPKPRGYEFWFMSEARKRNPKILLDCLPWAYPAWCGGDATQDTADWYVSFLDCAKKTYGLDLDYVGAVKNEGIFNPKWVVDVLRPTLDKAGYGKVKLQGPDTASNYWKIFEDAETDPAARKALDALSAVSYHIYSCPDATAKAKDSNKPLWMSETGAGSSWPNVARQTIAYYVKSRMTKFELWPPIASCYEGHTGFHEYGFIKAQQPWSGHYEVYDAVWVTAHVTQFTEPGWQFLDPGCKLFNATDPRSDAGCIALKDPKSNNWSIIAGTIEAATLKVHLGAGLETGPIHVWKSTLAKDIWKSADQAMFVQQADVMPDNGSLVLNLDANSIYSFTTTTGQKKATPPHPIPGTARFPMPYSENFASYAVGDAPKYFMDQKGTFEVAADGRGGKCLQQVLPAVGAEWMKRFKPYTIFGDHHWESYELSADVKIVGGDVVLGGWNDSSPASAALTGDNMEGYAFTLEKSGNWNLSYHFKPIENGVITGYDGSAWHAVKLRFFNSRIQAFVDGKPVGPLLDGDHDLEGLCFLGSTYHPNCFANLKVKPLASSRIPVSGMKAQATSNGPDYEPEKAIDGDLASCWHSNWSPMAPLPQALTVSLGATFNINLVAYVPRQDWKPTGIITEYNLYASLDGIQFQKIASGKWDSEQTKKVIRFPAIKAAFIKLEALAGSNGCAAVAELAVYQDGAPVATGKDSHMKK